MLLADDPSGTRQQPAIHSGRSRTGTPSSVWRGGLGQAFYSLEGLCDDPLAQLRARDVTVRPPAVDLEVMQTSRRPYGVGEVTTVVDPPVTKVLGTAPVPRMIFRKP
jgi:hypothetical protein